ncbi:MAG: tetratricopeptide repeat protein, partial [Methanothrix sp.]|nr:tetratricopeptide repeat protein [Methanothrix sp.]
GVQVAGQDAAGKSFSGITDSNGTAVVSGQAGEWLFVFIKDGYETLDLNYNVNETGEGAVYLVKSDQQTAQNALSVGSQKPEAAPQTDAAQQTQLPASDASSETPLADTQLSQNTESQAASTPDQISQNQVSQDQVSQTVYVYDGDFNGSLLPGVKIAGQDAAGLSFSGITDTNGIAVLSGQAGEWRFEFEKDGYKTLDLNYSVTETGDGQVYLVRSEESTEQVALQVAAYPNNEQEGPINSPQNLNNLLPKTSSIANATEESQLAANESETESAEFWLLNGNSLYEQGRYDEAAQSYDRCILLNPQIETAWFNKGNAHYMQGDYDNALSAFDKAILLNNQDANAWICRGLTLKKLNRNSEANAAFMQAKVLGYSG